MTNPLVSPAPDGSRLLTPDGHPFFVVIVNYVGHCDRAWAQFTDENFDPALIEADFRLVRQAGANTVRTFVAHPLPAEFTQGRWAKLDALVAAAERAGIYLLLTLADYSATYVQTLATHAGLIASRYAGNPTILAYDLKNEPRFYNLALMRYPEPVPLLSPELEQLYPPKHPPEEALRWAREEGRVPGWLPDTDAIRYANAYATLSACLQAASNWISARNYAATIVQFIRSPEAEPWQPFLEALDATLAAWLRPQVAAVREADPGRLITVGWSDPLLAGLWANSILDLHAVNRYPPNSPRWLAYHLNLAADLKAAFPGKPVLVSEFGYPTDTLEPAQAAIAEAAGWLRAFELGLAGTAKWALWDLPAGPNMRERTFGLFTAAGQPKPSALALPAIAEFLKPTRGPRGRLELDSSPTGGITYRFSADDVHFGSGQGRADVGSARWEGQGWAQLFVNCSQPGLVRVWSTAGGQVMLDVGQMLGLSDLSRYTLEADGQPLAHTRAGTVLAFPVTAGQPVTLRLPLDAVDARIVILWPHGDAPVTEARLANLTAYLTFPNSRISVPCDFDRPVILWRALDNEPAEPIAVGVRRLAEFNGRLLPVWDFNNVDVSLARDPAHKLYFTLEVKGFPYRSNVWVHGADARTYMPHQVVAEGTVAVAGHDAPAEIDAIIQIVWPHGGAAVTEAELANITVDLFRHGTRQQLVPAAAEGTQRWQPQVWLVRAVNNDVGVRVARATLRREGPGRSRWDFNDVDVSPARDPTSKVHFWVEVEGARTYSNFWTHGADARTYLPNPDLLLGNCV
jgi:hypothetical protein